MNRSIEQRKGVMKVLITLVIVLSVMVGCAKSKPQKTEVLKKPTVISGEIRKDYQVVYLPETEGVDSAELVTVITAFPMKISHVDDVPIEGGIKNFVKWMGRSAGVYAVALKPGEHSFKSGYKTRQAFAQNLKIKVQLEAGHNYLYSYDIIDSRIFLWVKDIETGEIVAGEHKEDVKEEMTKGESS